MFCSHFIFSSAEFILKLILTFRRLRIISKWSSTRSMKRYSCVTLAPLLPVQVSSRHFLISHIFPPKQNGKTWCVMELQSCEVGEGRQYRVVRHEKDDISVKVRGLPQLLPIPSRVNSYLLYLAQPNVDTTCSWKAFYRSESEQYFYYEHGNVCFCCGRGTLTYSLKPTPPSWPWQHQSTSEARRSIEEKRIWGFFTKTDTFLSLCQQEGAGNVTLTFPKTSEEALQQYHSLGEMVTSTGMQLKHFNTVPPQAHGLGSAPLQQVRHFMSPHTFPQTCIKSGLL